MKIGRKEALLALVATMVPWIGRRANAQVPREQLRDPVMRVQQSPEIQDLQKRLAALEAQLANQVAFTKDAAGNLLIRGNGSVRIDAATGVTVWAGSSLDLRASGSATLKGATIGLN